LSSGISHRRAKEYAQQARIRTREVAADKQQRAVEDQLQKQHDELQAIKDAACSGLASNRPEDAARYSALECGIERP
jgi:hypothetical protein